VPTISGRTGEDPSHIAPHSLPNGYRFVSILRTGSRAVIYRAIRELDDAPVLLKTSIAARPGERDTAQVTHEYAVLGKLVGTPVASALGLEQSAGRSWLVLEDPGGEPLNRIAARYRTPLRAIELGAQIASALAQVHHRGVVHRDVKPHHVIVLDDGSIRISGFRIASLLRVDSSNSFTQGTLAYMAPEQTGRMNRPVDKRADLYGLGVTLYELLTGRLPFEGNDPLEWVHAHIATVPVAPSLLDERIPASIDAIVLKLLAKHAEDRYHGASGLQHDLERCAAALAGGDGKPFDLGLEDPPDTFQVAPRLYGREGAVPQLLDGFERARSSGSCVVTLLGGSSGVGKTSVVGELYKPVVRERGRFIAGKSDQYKRDIPYTTIVQAFRELVRGLLAAGEASLVTWREHIGEALGVNGRLIVDVVPELELIIGPQPSVPDLDPREGQNRFELVFVAFVRVFAQPEHPLVIFLDDMQWADAATLALLQTFSRPGQIPDLQIVLAFRSNEVTESHPFQRAIDSMRMSGASVDLMSVLDLEPAHVLQLVADTVGRSPADAAALAKLISAKTGGNPFFIGELMHLLHARGLFEFDAKLRGWTWDEVAIRDVDVTNNVVDLLVGRIRSSSALTGRALALASCLGSRFDLSTLATLLDLPRDIVATALDPAVAEGFIVDLADTIEARRSFRFQHDRIQQAAYSLLDDAERIATHLHIGRSLRARLAGGDESLLFDSVNHLDQATEIIVDPSERAELATLNLLAGKRAKAAVAWEPARVYLEAAATLLHDESSWHEQYATTFSVHRELAECELLSGRFDAADVRFDELRRRAMSRAERADVATLQVKLYVVMGRYDEALQLGLTELEPFGEAFPVTEAEVAGAIAQERGHVSDRLTGVDLRSIVDRPTITTANPRALITLLTSLAPPVYSRRPSLFPLLAMRIVNLSLEHGNCEHSCFGYSMYAMILAGVEGDTARAVALSEASITLNERFDDPRLRGTVLHIHANHILYWRERYSAAGMLQSPAYLASMEVGDLTIAAYVSFMGAWQCIERGEPLGETEVALATFLDRARGSRHEAAQLIVQLQMQFGRALSGLTAAGTLSGAGLDADAVRTRIAQAGFDTGLVMHDLLGAMLAWHHEDYPGAEALLSRGAACLPAAFCLPLETTWTLFDALTASALWDSADVDARPALVSRVRRAEERLRAWARGCPVNFATKHSLVAAELARLELRPFEALRGYEHAAGAAREAEMLHLETVAAQLAIRLARSSELAVIGSAWLRVKHDVVSQWGATFLRDALEATNPELRTTPTSLPADTLSARSDQFEVLAAIKASQALARETTIEGLTQALLEIVLQQAGAQRAVILLIQDGRLAVARAAASNGVASNEVAESAVRYVERTQSSIVLADAMADATFADDPHVARMGVRSVLCMPIVVRSQLIGVLYLENNLASNAFSSERLALLEVVSAQLAISLDNARLFDERQQRAEDAAREEASATTVAMERARLTELFAQAPAAIAMLEGAEHVFTLANSRYRRIVGDRALDNLPARQAFPEVEGQGFFELLDGVFATGVPVEANEYRTKLQTPLGGLEDAYLDFVYQPLRHGDGTVRGIMVLAFDVTEKVRSREALHDQELRLRLAVEASAIGDWELDLSTGAITRSLRYDAIFGFGEGRSGFSYRELLEHVLPEERSTVEQSFQAAVTASAEWQIECPIRRGDGSTGWIELRARQRAGELGHPKRMFGTVIDITERKTAEVERRILMEREQAALRESEIAHRTKDEFLAMLGHELRNPLAPIVTALHLMELRDGERNVRERSIIERQVTHLVHLVDDLLDVSRITSGKIELKREPIELADVVAKAIEMVSPLLEQRRMVLTISVPREGLTVDGDMTRLAQVVSNLLANAAKYTEPDGQLTVIARRVAENVELRVRDTGIGIAPEMLPKVFDLFAQEAQALSRSKGGLGLGLAIVRSLMTLHGGAVSAHSAGLGQGSEFMITLPASTWQELPPVSVPTSHPTPTDGTAGLQILLVDDNEDAAQMLAEMLQSWGHTVRVAYDGPAALRIVANFTPQVAILDIGLPVMDGYELAQLLAQHRELRRTHLVALTGYGQETDRQRSKVAGFNAHMVKPINTSDLRTMLKSLVSAESDHSGRRRP